MSALLPRSRRLIQASTGLVRPRVPVIGLMLVMFAGMAFGHGSFHERLLQLAAELAKNPSDARLHFELADVNCHHGEWEESLRNLDRVEQLAPGKFLTDLLRGQAWLAGNQPAKARKALDALLAAHPESARAWWLRGRAAQRLGDAAGSIADFREALRRTAVWEPDLLRETADALAGDGRPREAAQILAEGISKLGDVPSLVLRSLELEVAIKDYDAALRRIEAMRRTAPRPEPWMARRASVLAQAGRIGDSRAAWQALVDHLAALPNLERGSHAMSTLAEEARHALSSLASLAPPDRGNAQPPSNSAALFSEGMAVAPVPGVIAASASSGTLSRGPYLQKAAPTQMTIRWRSSQSVVGRVRYGTSVISLNQVVDEAVAPPSPFNHTVTLTGLTPATTYYYSVGSASDTLASGSDCTFATPPVAGTVTSTRVWVLGDAGTSGNSVSPNVNQTAVRDAFYSWTGARIPNLVLQLGDNAYNSGTDGQFQKGVFDIYPTMLRKTPFWSCLGNHETAQSTAFVDTYPYFDIYTFPTAGECGGVASGTEHYYSFDYGNIHCIALDSMTADRSPSGAMAQWLQADLASTTATWVVCFFHHPPYTKGSHNSDTEIELIQMRENILPILEAGGVDLVLTGHSHCYERSFLLDGHYGVSGTLTSAMKKNAGDGRPLGAGAYTKPLTGPRDHFGAVYAVAGSAGQATGGALNHPAHYISLNNLGSLVLDVNGSRLDATFLRENSSTPDTFTIIKHGAADSDGDGIPDEYEIAHGLNRLDPADAALDSDGDGVTNLAEFIFFTSSNVPDRYAFTTTYESLAGTATVTFPTINGRTYRVRYSANLLAWQVASASFTGTGATMVWTDDGTTTGSLPSAAGKRFYRIEATVAP